MNNFDFYRPVGGDDHRELSVEQRPAGGPMLWQRVITLRATASDVASKRIDKILVGGVLARWMKKSLNRSSMSCFLLLKTQK
jgi:hypothetical protein